MPVNPRRVHTLRAAPAGGGPVLYWMSREQRVHDNWGLLHARELAGARRPLVAAFCLVPQFAGAALRQYDFMLRGLEETARTLRGLGIPLVLLEGDPGREVPALAARLRAGAVVTDFDPLRIKRGWQARAAQALDALFLEVDGHNIVPCRIASYKKEYAARTIRSRIHKLLPEFLEEFPPLAPQEAPVPDLPAPALARARQALRAAPGVPPVAVPAGEAAARAALAAFASGALARYAARRNDPNADAVSGLSPYLHFGQLAPQRAALHVAATGGGENQAAFLEELVVRRELSDNFCLHSPDYDTLAAAPDWARRTLDEHRDDPRAHLYAPGPSRPPPPTTRCGTPPRTRCAPAAACTATCACTGPRRFWNGRPTRKAPWPRPSPSTTATSSTAATPTATRASCGPWPDCTTGPGADDPSPAPSAP